MTPQRYKLYSNYSPINPLVSSAHKSVRNARISILTLEEIFEKICYECCVYESVDDRNTSYVISQKSTERKAQAL